jgi:hypothetical protein
MTSYSSIYSFRKKDSRRQIAWRDAQNGGNACIVVTRRMLLVKLSALPYNARKLAFLFRRVPSRRRPPSKMAGYSDGA